jgi:hypothetical protein
MPDTVELVMRFHPIGGEDISLLSRDYVGDVEAVKAITRALDERRSLVLTHARYNREAGENSVVINPRQRGRRAGVDHGQRQRRAVFVIARW